MADKTALIILGSGLYELYKEDGSKIVNVTTKYGNTTVTEIKGIGPARTFVILRHGSNHTTPPHMINYRANIQAAKELGVNYIIATASVGAINPKYSVGEYVLVDQFLDFTKHREFTFFVDPSESFRHTDMTHPYSERVRKALIKAAKTQKIQKFHTRGTYVCTEGPRFETPAEIRMFRRMGGDVVGMTGVPEVVLANEVGIEYGTLSQVTNMAAGLQSKITQSEVEEIMQKSIQQTKKVINLALEDLLK
ncbi:MAG: S-methyl-5'-thioinosine phosphorylase [Nitrososphaerota archaeon]|nr:S-methyl-5'-thioinosine phosphorylase [Nitrososphaerota archaeon]